MEAISRFAARTAHDFGNLLTIIRGFAEFFSSQRPDDPELRECFKEIIEAVDRASVMSEQLLVIGRRRATEIETVDLPQALRGLSAPLQALLGDAIRLELQLGRDPLPVQVDPKGLEWIVTHLCAHAKGAMPQGGMVTIRTAQLGTSARLSVQDNGIGYEASMQTHFFEPFFLKTQVGCGQGLELAMVYSLVSQYDGRIDVESAPERGTTFHMDFPCAASLSSAGEEA